MIKQCNDNKHASIFTYIGRDYPRCLYLYLDLKKYSFSGDKITVYIQEDDNGITAVLLRYYSCLHVYARDLYFDAEEIANFFTRNNLTMLYCARNIAERVYNFFTDDIRNKVETVKGWVARIEAIDQRPRGYSTRAEEEDFDQIVRMIYSDDDIGKSYKLSDLSNQIKERNLEGFSRNIVIKRNEEVIAHASTNAEYDNIAVIGELLVKEKYRRHGYASEIWRELCCQLLNEGKEVYSFYFSKESRNLHKKIGFIELCEWEKIVFLPRDR